MTNSLTCKKLYEAEAFNLDCVLLPINRVSKEGRSSHYAREYSQTGDMKNVKIRKGVRVNDDCFK